MLGLGKIDPLALRVLDVDGNLRRAGALRRLAELYASRDPAIACVHGIDAGEALGFATRFDRQWGYRGGAALFWRKEIRAHVVHDRYMPIAPLRPFDRRGLLHVEAELDKKPLAMLALNVGDDRATCVRDLRFARTVLRRISGAAILFAGNAARSRIGFEDLGFRTIARDDYNLIVVRPSHATPPPHTAGSQEASASIERI